MFKNPCGCKMRVIVLSCALILVIKIETITGQTEKNNVCRTSKDYNSMSENPNCWFDYAVDASVAEIIEHSGRPVQEHRLTTDDGYILTMFRIPNNHGRNLSVFLQHGLITTCANWISLGDDSLAFQLYDNGYDVWLGNYRGNQYSNKHLNYSQNDNEFWDYSMDEVATKDIPAMLKKISETTGRTKNIIYIGHSLGTTFSLMYGSDRPEEAANYIKFQILTAPAYTLSHMRNLLAYAVPFTDTIFSLVNQFPGLSNIVSKEKTTKGVLKLICTDSAEMMEQCMNLFFGIYGVKTEVLPEKYPLFFNQHPSGTAWKLIKHVSDLVKNHFRKFDYGINNVNIYGSYLPPEYDISKTRIPTVVMFARNDWLTPKMDAINLYRKLPENIRRGIFEVTEENFNHIDFMFGKRAKDLYIDKVLEILNTRN